MHPEVVGHLDIATLDDDLHVASFVSTNCWTVRLAADRVPARGPAEPGAGEPGCPNLPRPRPAQEQRPATDQPCAERRPARDGGDDQHGTDPDLLRTPARRSVAATVAPVVSTSSSRTTPAPTGGAPAGPEAHPARQVGEPRGGVEADRVGGAARGAQARSDARRHGRRRPAARAAAARHRGHGIAAARSRRGPPARRGHQPERPGVGRPIAPAAQQPAPARRRARRPATGGRSRRPRSLPAMIAARAGAAVPGQGVHRRHGRTGGSRRAAPSGMTAPRAWPTGERGARTAAPRTGAAAARAGSRQHQVERVAREPPGARARRPTSVDCASATPPPDSRVPAGCGTARPPRRREPTRRRLDGQVRRARWSAVRRISSSSARP